MRSIENCLTVSSFDLTDEERMQIKNWIDKEARHCYDSYSFCCLLGWFMLDNRSLPLSPKEAGFD